jgi:hypothetical protein
MDVDGDDAVTVGDGAAIFAASEGAAAAAAAAAERRVTLVASDGVAVTVPRRVARVSGLIAAVLEEEEEEGDGAAAAADEPVPLPGVASGPLRHVLAFCERRCASPPPLLFHWPVEQTAMADTRLPAWAARLADDIAPADLHAVGSAADYLDVRDLVYLVATRIATLLNVAPLDAARFRRLVGLEDPGEPPDAAVVRRNVAACPWLLDLQRSTPHAEERERAAPT